VSPLIAITCDRGLGAAGTGVRERPARVQVRVNEVVVDAVRRAGGIPVLLPPGGAEAIGAVLDLAQGVVITGGAFDIHPRHYGQAVLGRLDPVEEARAALEIPLARQCAERDVPILGICGGMQAQVVALGGTLVQDIRAAQPDALEHEQPVDPAQPWHAIDAAPEWAARLSPRVNSTHHQSADALGPLRVIARAPDGVVEATCLDGHPFFVGVQWHPELLPDSGPLFVALIEAASRSRRGTGAAARSESTPSGRG
jgi:putative glutamine amidotransferase